MKQPLIHAKNMTKQVQTGEETLTILQDISISIMHGDTIAILGVSGSGKTTLLSLLAGLDLPTRGEIYYQDVQINRLSESERAKLRQNQVGFVFQNFQLLPHLTALENVAMPLELACHVDATNKAKQVLQKVGLLDRMAHYPHQLSGGEQQRVSIARAFALAPKILFADEPTGNLDEQTGHTIIDCLSELNQAYHTTLVIVTHDQQLASHCNTLWLLQHGQIQNARA